MSNGTESTLNMSVIWAIIVSIIILMVIYAYVSSKLSARKKEKQRAETLPEIKESIKTGVLYNIFLSGDENFERIEILGSIDGEDSELTFGNWKGMFILKKENGKKVFIKKSSIKFIEEI